MLTRIESGATVAYPDRPSQALVTLGNGWAVRVTVSPGARCSIGFGRLLSTGDGPSDVLGKKVKKNQFGCVDGGKFCTNSGQCCSGICSGKTGKQTCRAHDQSTCQVGQVSSPCSDDVTECVTSTGDLDGACHTTTGKAAYCSGAGLCTTCQKDADREAVCGTGAACVPCAAKCAEGTACLGLSSGSCDDV